jgi:DNA-binding XRE family transcriptional regulator
MVAFFAGTRAPDEKTLEPLPIRDLLSGRRPDLFQVVRASRILLATNSAGGGPERGSGTIRKLRNAQNLTQEMVSARCGVAGYEITRGTLAKIEAQIRGASDIEVFVIARALRVSVETLFPPRFGARLKSGEFAKPVEHLR